MPTLDETYEEYVARGIKKIRKELEGEIFWNPVHRGHAFAVRVNILKDKGRIYRQKLDEGRKKIAKDMESTLYWQPALKGRVFGYRVKKLEEKLRLAEDL